MKIIKPTTITSAMLVSSTATEVHATWSSGTTYALGAKVVYGNFIYESLQASNLNKQPDTQVTWWTKLSSSNKWACVDGTIESKTTAATSLTYTIASGTIDSVAVLGINATSVTCTVRNGLGGSIIYEQTQGLNGDVQDWYQYFFFDLENVRVYALFRDIPPYVNSHVTITFAGSSISVCETVVGREYALGITQGSPSSGIIDYSRKETDAFGNTTFVKRAFSKKMDADVWVENYNLNQVQRLLYDLRATPTLWIASDDPYLDEPLVVYGFYKDFSTSITYPSVSLVSIQIEGLI